MYRDMLKVQLIKYPKHIFTVLTLILTLLVAIKSIDNLKSISKLCEIISYFPARSKSG